ncbi:DUF5067 domain-containing protein [Listeria monocytogenes]|nr:DUF5067 domain-containing protein [Listeria monocytogenes]
MQDLSGKIPKITLASMFLFTYATITCLLTDDVTVLIMWIVEAIYPKGRIFRNPKGFLVLVITVFCTMFLIIGSQVHADIELKKSLIERDKSLEEYAKNKDEIDSLINAEKTFKDGVLENGYQKIKITKHKVIPAGEKGNENGFEPVIAFWFEITNKTNEKLSPNFSWWKEIDIYQIMESKQAIELEEAPLPDDQFLSTYDEDIKKGVTVQSAVAYYLFDDAAPVDLVYGGFLGGEVYGKTRYQIK